MPTTTARPARRLDQDKRRHEDPLDQRVTRRRTYVMSAITPMPATYKGECPLPAGRLFQPTYFVGPDSLTIYPLPLWPTLPDETRARRSPCRGRTEA